ncbi:hypothetical protein XENOCAPTIV_008706, partial [Xenoophorus captivus]
FLGISDCELILLWKKRGTDGPSQIKGRSVCPSFRAMLLSSTATVDRRGMCVIVFFKLMFHLFVNIYFIILKLISTNVQICWQRQFSHFKYLYIIMLLMQNIASLFNVAAHASGEVDASYHLNHSTAGGILFGDRTELPPHS